MGFIVLEGGAEFNDRMAEPDLKAIELAGGRSTPIAIVPTAAAPDRNHEQAGNRGLDWFSGLGAESVDLVMVVDGASANDAGLAAKLRQARLIYMLGGFPGYLNDTLHDSRCWRAMRAVFADGGVIAGSSAGAMVLCEHLYDPQSGQVVAGLGMVSGVCIVPHHDTFGADWPKALSSKLRGQILLGIDEETGAIGTGPAGEWTVYGKGAVTVYAGGDPRRYEAGAAFILS